ncbi:MAG: cell wall-associated protein wapA, partial [Bdellovibrionaceae bacterium]|nr:cell wall-associated protein wapA [Pseudobdellovibrionaceae bacterium]
MKHLLALVFGLLYLPAAHAIVDMRSANFSDTWTDIIVPGSGYDLRIRRTYSSRSLFNGMFGFGWCSDFETKLEITAENNLLLTECGGGAEITFRLGGNGGGKVSTTIESILKEVKKRNAKLTTKDINRLREDLRKDQYLRMALARKLDLGGKIQKGKVYRANGVETENIVLKKNTYIRTLAD